MSGTARIKATTQNSRIDFIGFFLYYKCIMLIDFTGFNLAAYLSLKILPLVLMGILIFNLIQKRFIRNWGKKRLASFYIAIMVLIFMALAFLVFKYRLPDWILIPGLFILTYFAVLKRKTIFPFVLNCEKCSNRLKLFTIFLQSENICKTCLQEESDENKDSPE